MDDKLCQHVWQSEEIQWSDVACGICGIIHDWNLIVDIFTKYLKIMSHELIIQHSPREFFLYYIFFGFWICDVTIACPFNIFTVWKLFNFYSEYKTRNFTAENVITHWQIILTSDLFKWT